MSDQPSAHRRHRRRRTSGTDLPRQRDATRSAAAPLESPEDAALLQHAVDEAARLLHADGGMIYLLDPGSGELGFAHDAGITDDRRRVWVRGLRLAPGVGMFGRAVAERRVIATGDYASDASFRHAADPERVVREVGIRSMVVAPLIDGDQVAGGLGVFADRPDAFGEAEIALVGALAQHAATAMANRRLIADLDRSTETLTRRAESERSLREIGARIVAIRESGALLQHVVDEAARLLRADGARIDLLEPRSGGLYWAYDARTGRRPGLGPVGGAGEARAGEGISGRAVTERRAIWTGDYLDDQRFEHAAGPDGHVRRHGLRSVIAAPLGGGDQPFGTLTVYTAEPNAYGPVDAELIEALANQAGIAIRNTQLIEALERSREEMTRRADAERTLREIGARISAVRDPDAILHLIAAEGARLLGEERVFINLLNDPTGAAGWIWYSPTETGHDDWPAVEAIRMGEGVTGKAIAERRPFITGDYLADDRFVHRPGPDRYTERLGLASAMAVPMFDGDQPLGAMLAETARPDAFDETDAALLDALAQQAAIAITNARLIAGLAASREELSRRVETEQALRQIAARITSLREPGGVLQQIVEESRRLLGSDGAHLTLMSEDRTYVYPVVIAGSADAETEAWMRTQRFPVDGGLNGLAAGSGIAHWTRDYPSDPRLPHDADDEATATRMGLRGMAVAPLRAPEGEIVGTLAISYREPRDFAADEIELLQGLADHAAIALLNARLLVRVQASEARYRFLIDNSPDIIFSADADGRFTFVGDSIERLLGFRAGEVVGSHFAVLVDEASLPLATERFREAATDPGREVSARLLLRHRDGRRIPFEVVAIGVERDGVFSGIHGASRDVSERARLERELRDSETRYRYLVRTSPDFVWAVDEEGRFTFASDRIEELTGWRPEELIGEHFSYLLDPAQVEAARGIWADVRAHPTEVRAFRSLLRARDGEPIVAELHAVGMAEDGVFRGAHGSVRDMRERDRLERELRDSEARYRHLVQSSPDGIWQASADGTFTFWSETAESVFGWPATTVVGQHWGVVVVPDSMPAAEAAWARLAAAPDTVVRVRVTMGRPDGTRVPAEVSAVPVVRDGVFVGAHGLVRDLREQERLERELLRQAGELASSQERAHLARELHDSVTQALFSMTLVTRTIELLMARDPTAAAEKIASLRELQRDALAEMRSLIFELRPGSLEQDGLVKALRTHAAAVEGRVGMPIVVDADELERLAPPVEEACYRIAQEALHNVVKHAVARSARIEIAQVADGLRLRIDDDGQGFDPGAVPAGHLGVAGMHARAERVGGRLAMTSAPGGGTRVEVVVPLGAAPTDPRLDDAVVGSAE